MESFKITAFVGSARKKNTYNAVERFMINLKLLGNVEYEIIPLNDYRLEACIGCKLCMDKGEELCPLKDDRDLLIGKMLDADGIVFATPNYSFHVSALTKLFLDRLGFLFHRPCLFGKTYTAIVTQGVYGGKKIVKYLDFIGGALGCNTVKGSCLATLEPMSAKERLQVDETIRKQSLRFYRTLIKKSLPSPGLFKLMIFRMSRTSMKISLDENNKDYGYYAEKGWFDSDYYYPVRMNVAKKAAGKLFDGLAKAMTRNRNL